MLPKWGSRAPRRPVDAVTGSECQGVGAILGLRESGEGDRSKWALLTLAIVVLPLLKLRFGLISVGLVAVKGELGEAKVTPNELLQAALRLRPDRIVLGELRGSESVSFLRAINTGHPGSFSTIHANSLRGALEQLSLMVMQTGIGLTRTDTIAYAASVIDVIVQLGRDANGKRGITAISESRSLI